MKVAFPPRVYSGFTREKIIIESPRRLGRHICSSRLLRALGRAWFRPRVGYVYPVPVIMLAIHYRPRPAGPPAAPGRKILRESYKNRFELLQPQSNTKIFRSRMSWHPGTRVIVTMHLSCPRVPTALRDQAIGFWLFILHFMRAHMAYLAALKEKKCIACGYIWRYTCIDFIMARTGLKTGVISLPTSSRVSVCFVATSPTQ